MSPSGAGNGEIAIYDTPEGKTELEVKLERQTLWLDQYQLAELFETDRTSVLKHIRNIYETGELSGDATCAKFAQVRREGKRSVTRHIRHYNLDMILSVGYRVNSRRGTQFRIWANNVMREYLIKGYALNERRLTERERELRALKSGIQLLERSVANQARQLEEARTLVSIIADFSTGLEILDDYDYGRLDVKGLTEKEAALLSYEECKSPSTSPLHGRKWNPSSTMPMLWPYGRKSSFTPSHAVFSSYERDRRFVKSDSAAAQRIETELGASPN